MREEEEEEEEGKWSLLTFQQKCCCFSSFFSPKNDDGPMRTPQTPRKPLLTTLPLHPEKTLPESPIASLGPPPPRKKIQFKILSDALCQSRRGSKGPHFLLL
ncbi:hypothetical protein E2320_022133 [Naja naja]|nr:hypothetical protein E2320_022133 [Naja naja]